MMLCFPLICKGSAGVKGNAQDIIFKGLAGLGNKLDFNLQGFGGHGW